MHYTIQNPIIIIDGSLYLYRSYFAFQNTNTNEENPFGAIYGMLKMIEKILKKYYYSQKIIIIFDASQKTFRNKIFKEYKIQRPSMPQSLYVQILPLFKILKKIGIKTVQIPGIEADDIIGSYANQFEKNGEKILIISNDKDMLQLVTDNINILHTHTNTIVNPQKIQDKYGIKPKEFIDLLALMGDTSDNIPGIPKIGIKTALILLKNFSNIINIYKNIDSIQYLSLRNSNTIIAQLKKYKDTAFLSYKLAKIQLNLPISITDEEITIKKPYILNQLTYLIKKYKNTQKRYLF